MLGGCLFFVVFFCLLFALGGLHAVISNTNDFKQI